MMDRYRVKPGTAVNLSQFDPADKSGFVGDKDAAKRDLKTLNNRLEELQELLYAEGKQKLLVVLQAMDTGGKDGVIRHVFDGVNPQGVKVASFKKPTSHMTIYGAFILIRQAGVKLLFSTAAIMKMYWWSGFIILYHQKSGRSAMSTSIHLNAFWRMKELIS